MRPIRVLHVVSCLGHGGMEAGVMKLVTGCDPSRVISDVCTLERAQAFQDLFTGDSKLHELSRSSAFDVGLVSALAGIMRTRCVDVVHTHAWGTLLEGSLAATWSRTAHVVHGEHGTMELKPLNVRLQRVLWRKADRLLAVSHELANRMTARVGVRRDEITVIPNGVDTERFGHMPREQARKALSLPVDVFVVVAIGRLVAVKNYPLLIEAARLVRAAGVHLQLLVAGDGPLRDELEQRIRDAGMEGTVRLLGVRTDTSTLLAAADAFALTSRSEGMSNTILEAMAAGRPVVATRVGGNPELVQEGVTGLLVTADSPQELAESLLALSADRARSEQLGARARQRVEAEFSVRRMIARYTDLYESINGRGQNFNCVSS